MLIRSPLPAAAPLAFAASLAAVPAFAGAPHYHMTAIEIPGAQGIYARDINDAGQIVGYYIDENFINRAFLYDANGVHDLGVPTSDTEVDSEAAAINNSGQIVGYAMVWDHSSPGLIWPADDPATYTSLSDDATVALMPADISDNGTVVGLKGGFQTGEAFHGFVWTAADGVVDYGTTDTDDPTINASWTAVNDAGNLVGVWNYQFALLHAAAGMVGTPAMLPMSAASDAVESGALAIDASGTSVGYMDVDGSGNAVPVVFDIDGNATAIPGATLGLVAGQALGINDAGVIVGRAQDFSTLQFKAFVAIDGVAYDVLDVSDGSAGFDYLLTAQAVNEHGVIVGLARFGDLQVGSYILTPVADDAIFADGFDAN